MKKNFLRAILPFFLALCMLTLYKPSVSHAQAEQSNRSEYACILTDDVFFYAGADERRGVFLLPKTYFVKILEHGAEYCKIEYLYDGEKTERLIGYAKTDKLTFVEFTPNNPYLYHVFDVRYRIDDSEITDSSFLTQITVSCAYYGDYAVGSKTYCYVLRDGEFGYIPKPNDLSYPENTEYQDYLDELASSQPPPSTPSQTDPTVSPVQIAILVALCLLVPILAALILKQPKRPPYELDD